jgi:hypothetical protein
MPATRDEFEARIVVLRERNRPDDSQEEPF